MQIKVALARVILCVLTAACAPHAGYSQVLLPGSDAPIANPLADTSMNPGKALLFDLEAKFAKATLDGGGKAFATFFAEDGVSLGNGQPPVHGRDAIAKKANWAPKDYQLIWTPTDAVMSPAGDMGYTWGHYEGHSKDANNNPVVTSGRYLTIWRHEPDGSWKVLLDSSNDEPPGAGDCCKLPPGM